MKNFLLKYKKTHLIVSLVISLIFLLHQFTLIITDKEQTAAILFFPLEPLIHVYPAFSQSLSSYLSHMSAFKDITAVILIYELPLLLVYSVVNIPLAILLGVNLRVFNGHIYSLDNLRFLIPIFFGMHFLITWVYSLGLTYIIIRLITKLKNTTLKQKSVIIKVMKTEDKKQVPRWNIWMIILWGFTTLFIGWGILSNVLIPLKFMSQPDNPPQYTLVASLFFVPILIFLLKIGRDNLT